MRLGDLITFRVQGIPMDARIANIRTRTGTALSPTFTSFSLKEPHRCASDPFRGVRVKEGTDRRDAEPYGGALPECERHRSHGNCHRLRPGHGEAFNDRAIFHLSSASPPVVLIIISSVFATRYARIQEAVYFTILGARRRFVLALFGCGEPVPRTPTSAFSALILAQAGSWIICRIALDVTYRPFVATSLLMVLATTLLVVTVGLGASLSILRQKPARFLREQTEE